jgi:hypothetical protein
MTGFPWHLQMKRCLFMPVKTICLTSKVAINFQLATSFGVANAAIRTVQQRETDEYQFQESHPAIVELFSDY